MKEALSSGIAEVADSAQVQQAAPHLRDLAQGIAAWKDAAAAVASSLLPVQPAEAATLGKQLLHLSTTDLALVPTAFVITVAKYHSALTVAVVCCNVLAVTALPWMGTDSALCSSAFCLMCLHQMFPAGLACSLLMHWLSVLLIVNVKSCPCCQPLT